MLVTKDNINELKVGQTVYAAHHGFKMIKRYIYLGIHNFSEANNWFKHVFYSHMTGGIDFSSNLNEVKESDLPESLRWKMLYTTYEEACERSREGALHLIQHYNTHDFKNNPIKVLENGKNSNSKE